MPLNRNMALVGQYDGEWGTADVEKESVATVNYLTMLGGGRFVYGPVPDFLWFREPDQLGGWNDLVALLVQDDAPPG